MPLLLNRMYIAGEPASFQIGKAVIQEKKTRRGRNLSRSAFFEILRNIRADRSCSYLLKTSGANVSQSRTNVAANLPEPILRADTQFLKEQAS